MQALQLLFARGNLEKYEFPESALVDEDKGWSLTVHNNGAIAGDIYAAIGNYPENPSRIVVIWQGKEYTVEPGYMQLFYGTRTVCGRIEISGQVRFPKEGNYRIQLSGGHAEAGWKMDTYKDVTVKVEKKEEEEEEKPPLELTIFNIFLISLSLIAVFGLVAVALRKK